MHETKVPITEKALFARVARALRKNEEALCRCRENSRGRHDLGRYYIVDARRNAVIDTQVDLVELARKLNRLAEFEAPVVR